VADASSSSAVDRSTLRYSMLIGLPEFDGLNLANVQCASNGDGQGASQAPANQAFPATRLPPKFGSSVAVGTAMLESGSLCTLLTRRPRSGSPHRREQGAIIECGRGMFQGPSDTDDLR
jgi:hypothetical protein